MTFKREVDIIVIELPKDSFTESALFQCLYWYTGRFIFETDGSNQYNWKVTFHLEKNKLNEIQTQEFILKLSQDFHDYRLRSIVDKETGLLRELIAAKAFSHLAPETDPDTEVSDPVGFNPNIKTI